MLDPLGSVLLLCFAPFLIASGVTAMDACVAASKPLRPHRPQADRSRPRRHTHTHRPRDARSASPEWRLVKTSSPLCAEEEEKAKEREAAVTRYESRDEETASTASTADAADTLTAR